MEPMRTRSLGLALLLTGCGDGIGIDPFFADELVEAPARSLGITVLPGSSSCETVATKTSSEIAVAGDVVAKKESGYPIDPTSDEVFAELPTDQRLTFDVVARDSGGLQMGRGCASFQIDELEAAPRIELRALPACTVPVTRVDVTLVIDTSVRMGIADPEVVHIDELMAAVLDPVAALPGTVWSVITFGHADQELVPPTTDLEAVRSNVRTLVGVAMGKNKLFDAVAKAAELTRARAVCGTRSVIFVLASDADDGSTRSFEDAQVSLVASRGDPTDDLYMIGIALHEGGVRDLDDLVPMTVDALITGAGNRAQMGVVFREARDKIIELSRPPMP